MSLHDSPRPTPTPARPRFGRPRPFRGRRAFLPLGLIPLLTGLLLPVRAASPLLESVKQNPQIARNLCAELRNLNKQGVTATSPQAVALVASRQGLSPTDAEILTTYVVGLHCPDVR